MGVGTGTQMRIGGGGGGYIDTKAATQGTWLGPWIWGIIETDQIRRGCLPLETL